MKFQSTSLNSVQLTERKKLHLVTLQGKNLEKRHARVVVLVHETSSECVLNIYVVSLKYRYRFI